VYSIADFINDGTTCFIASSVVFAEGRIIRMNILITSAGRRGYLVNYFKQALGTSGKVYAGNSEVWAPAFCYADDYVVTPLVYDQEYIPFLMRFCSEKNITLIISLLDIDLLVLAKNKKLFEDQGITVVVSDETVINICNDKWKTYLFCTQNKILTAQTYLKLGQAEQAISCGYMRFPVLIKPRWGMGSLVIYEADSTEEMKVLFQKCRRDIQNTYLKYESAADQSNCVLIQEKLGGQEYGMDVINNLHGSFCGNIVRKKIAMRSGETDCAMVVQSAEMNAFAKDISKKLGHIGNLDVDIFIEDRKIYLLEMNARIGGGYPFSHFAGIDLPRAILKWVSHEPINQELTVKKYGQVIQKDIGFVNLTEHIYADR